VKATKGTGRRGPQLMPDWHPIAVKLPREVHDAMKAAASANYEAPSAWVRRVIVERLRHDGVLPAVSSPKVEA